MGHSSGRLLDTPTVTRIKADVRGSFAELAIFAASGLLGLVRARTPGGVDRLLQSRRLLSIPRSSATASENSKMNEIQDLRE